MNLHQRAITTICIPAYLMFWECPAEQPFCILCTHVDASVTHRHTEVFVPVCAMECVSLGSEKTSPGNAGEFVVVGIGKEVPIAHVFGRIFFKNTEFALRCFCGESIFAARTVGDSRRDGRL